MLNSASQDNWKQEFESVVDNIRFGTTLESVKKAYENLFYSGNIYKYCLSSLGSDDIGPSLYSEICKSLLNAPALSVVKWRITYFFKWMPEDMARYLITEPQAVARELLAISSVQQALEVTDVHNSSQMARAQSRLEVRLQVATAAIFAAQPHLIDILKNEFEALCQRTFLPANASTYSHDTAATIRECWPFIIEYIHKFTLVQLLKFLTANEKNCKELIEFFMQYLEQEKATNDQLVLFLDKISTFSDSSFNVAKQRELIKRVFATHKIPLIEKCAVKFSSVINNTPGLLGHSVYSNVLNAISSVPQQPPASSVQSQPTNIPMFWAMNTSAQSSSTAAAVRTSEPFLIRFMADEQRLQQACKEEKPNRIAGLLQDSYDQNEQLEIVKLFLSQDVLSMNANKNKSLLIAIYLENQKLVKYLIADEENKVFLINYFSEQCRSSNVGMVKKMLSLGPDLVNVNQRNKDGYLPLLIAAKRSDTEIVKALINAGADLDMHSPDGLTPLHRAAWFNQFDVIELLITEKKEQVKWLNIPLEQQLQKIKQFVNACIEVNSNFIDTTPLHLAIIGDQGRQWTESTQMKCLKIVQCLLKEGADVNIRDANGNTALHEACKSGQTEIVKVLLGHGADRAIVNSEGKRPIQIAKDLGHAEICALPQLDISSSVSAGMYSSVSSNESKRRGYTTPIMNS